MLSFRNILLTGLLVPACAAVGCSRGSATPDVPIRPPVLVKVAPAERRDVPFLVRAPGLVMASETVEVHSRIDSQVMEVHFREGDMVHAGQLLFTLDDRTMSADLRRQEATLATAQAELDNARRQYERAGKLAAGGFESTAELDKARADFESTQAQTNATFNFGQPNKDNGKEVEPPKAAETYHVKCDVHPWMGAYVAVF